MNKNNSATATKEKMQIIMNKNNLALEVKSQVIEILQKTLSASMDLQSHAKQAHWNVKGSDFYSLHLLFDQVSTEVLPFIDEIAERIVQLGGIAKGTIRFTAENTFLIEYPLEIQAGREHVEALSNSLANFASDLRQGIDKTTEIGDVGTADLLTGISRAIEKLLWFVEAHNQSH
jgi:starvation-inducible DNA-binding protein